MQAMLDGVAPFALASVQLACLRFRDGQVAGFNTAFPPEAPQLIAEARRLDEDHVDGPDMRTLVSYPMGGKPPDGYLPLGPVEVNFGGRTINMRDMRPSEREEVLANKGLPPADGKRIGFTPKLKRMAE